MRVGMGVLGVAAVAVLVLVFSVLVVILVVGVGVLGFPVLVLVGVDLIVGVLGHLFPSRTLTMLTALSNTAMRSIEHP